MKVALLSIGVVLLAGCYFAFSPPNGNTLPRGPRALPLLGNLIQFSALRARPDLELLRLAKQYGQMCMLWFGSNPVLIVNSPKVAKDMMDKVRDGYLLFCPAFSSN